MVLAIFTGDEIMRIGLDLAGFSLRRQSRVMRKTNVERFKSFYGAEARVYAQIWEDLQTTNIPAANIGSVKPDIESFLMAVNFLKEYPTEKQRSGLRNYCETTARNWAWYYTKKVQALKGAKVRVQKR